MFVTVIIFPLWYGTYFFPQKLNYCVLSINNLRFQIKAT